MEALLPYNWFTLAGHYLMIAILLLSAILGLSGSINICGRPIWQRFSSFLLLLINLLFISGFLLICFFHYQIYLHLPLALEPDLCEWINRQLEGMNSRSMYAMALLDPAAPPRFFIPPWIENEKYYFWFLCFNLMALVAHLRLQQHRFRALLHLILALQVGILFFYADPFGQPLPKFFSEITPWFSQALPDMERLGFFMRLYPRMIFYYNAHYMWFHPPLLFLAYACITITFSASLFMLHRQQANMEEIAYDFAKLGYFMLTLGMLLGYPWALQAWGPNWWWDPKICSSIMMWVVFSTYLHARLYVNRTGMWYFSAFLGIICFLAMIFTFLTSFFFPGEHTFQ